MTNIDYLYNPDAARERFDRNYFVDKKLGFRVIEHGMILPHKSFAGEWFGRGGIVDNNGKFINSSSTWFVRDGVYTPSPRINSTQHGDRRLSRILLSGMGTRLNRQYQPRVVP